MRMVMADRDGRGLARREPSSHPLPSPEESSQAIHRLLNFPEESRSVTEL
jgi:hypothetical protein